MEKPNEGLLKFYFEPIENAYVRALRNGPPDPVVFVYRTGEEDPVRGTKFEISVGSRDEAIAHLSKNCPDAVPLVATPDPSRPMTVVIMDEGLTVFDCTPAADFADGMHEAILKSCVEDAEMQWLQGKSSGLVDPVVSVFETDRDGPGGIRIGIGAVERDEMIAELAPTSREAADRLAISPAPHTPMTVVIRTKAGVTVLDRPGP